MAEENPRKRRGRKKGGRKRSTPKTRTRTRTVTKWKTRTRNPGKPRTMRSRAKSGLAALDIGHAIRGSIALVGGMILAKVAVNKITSNGSETERWSWPNIATAALAGFLGAFILGAVFKLPRQTTSYIFMGGLALAVYKAFTCKIAPQWTWTTTWFGQDEDVNPALLGAGGEIDVFEPVPVDGSGEYEVVDGYGQDSQEVLNQMGFAGNLVPYNPQMGDTLSPVYPEMGFGGLSPYPAGIDQRAADLVKMSKAYPGSY